ncbi:MAG TPA: DNA repair protein RadC [Thermodesulfovibrionia bacterium]|nr:DNA repair protein RadC [Thermodesulfovibrionia bacterium]
MKYQSIKNWPEDERPRERLLRFGADELSTAQLLAIILRTGGRNKSAIELAREILVKFKNLKEIEDASIAEFSELKGIGAAKIAQIKAAFELGKRLIANEKRNTSQQPCFKNSGQVYTYYMPKFYGLKKEKFLCTLLDTKNKVFKETTVSEGTLTSSLVHPREVFRYAIKEAAASVLFVHNHPSGDPSPSRDDIDITKRLIETGKIIGINVLDHIIIGDGRYLSLIESGYLNQKL